MKLLRDRQYLDALLKAIGKARRSIEARIFLIDPGRLRKKPVMKILRALRDAQKKRVRVSLLTDGIFRSKASGRRLHEAVERLGLKIQWDKQDTILHEKTIQIDGRTLIVGSHNWTNPSLLENRELSLQLSTAEGPPGKPGGPAAVPARGFMPRAGGGEAKLSRPLTRRPPLNASDFSKSLLRDIEKARQEITIASYDLDESSNPYDFGTKLTQALIRAERRGVKVRLLLDASQNRVPETGEIFYHYRGERKAEELVRSGVQVYYDSTLTLFHPKIAIFDDHLVYVGSQNLEVRKDATVLEATIRLDSKKISSEIKTYLAEILRQSQRYRYDPSDFVGIRLPFSFLEKKGVFSRMYTHQSEETFRFYVKLLRKAWKTGSNRVERRWPPRLQDDRRRLVRVYRVFRYEPGSVKRLPQVTLVDPETAKPFVFPDKDFFTVPDSFFDFGWFGRLTHGEIFLFWIHLAQSQRSSESPFWSMGQPEITRQFGINRSNLTQETISLERWNLIEVIRDPKIVFRNVVKRPNRYRLNPIGSLEEYRLTKQRMLQGLGMRQESMKEAEKLASLLNQPHDLEVIRKFLLLMERHGPENVRKATQITARFKPHFALRNVHHTAAILRNWSLGIRKTAGSS